MPRPFFVALALLAFAAPIARADDARPIDFRTDVIAALSRAGCNQGACHGSPNGKNGFRLSLRGFEPDVDIFTLTRGEMGRRIDRTRPENSLFLLKAIGNVPHQGGVRFKVGEPAYQVLLRWVAEGARDAGPTVLEKLEVSPETFRLPSGVTTKQLTVRAHFKGGEIRDVTDLCVFSVNIAGAATVTGNGLVEFNRTGEASILVRYLDQIRSARLQYVRIDSKFAFKEPTPATISTGTSSRNRKSYSSTRPRSRRTRSSCAVSISTPSPCCRAPTRPERSSIQKIPPGVRS